MKPYEAKALIKDVFESSFDKEKYKLFIKNLLKDIEEKSFFRTGNIIPKHFQNVIRKYERIGKFEDKENNKIDILIVELKRDRSIEWARSSQRNFVRWYLTKFDKDAALVAFHSEKSPDWRFSFIKMQYSLETKKDELTPAKRYSFLVGEKGKSHTAQQQLVRLLKSDDIPLLSDIEEAFNIETVTNEFFEKYRDLTLKLKEQLDKILESDLIVKNEFENKNIQTIDFAKKLMGQIVFIYFLQRKGWLGLQNGQKYGEGDRNFLRTLYNMKRDNENFFNDYLEYLFYEALSQKRVTDFYPRFNCRIPFLNGGLFDPINFYEWEKTDIVIPDELFTNSNKTKEGDIGDGILDIFDRYNFTVKEDEPLDKEVAVDPEMLGKVFERMLDVKERKSKGAFYTPREIVHYMAKESLIHYLDSALNSKTKVYQKLGENQTNMFGNKTAKQTELQIEVKGARVPKEDIETLIKHGEKFLENEEQVLLQGGETHTYKHKIPQSIRKYAKEIDKALADIRVCDPAVGSGAFPVGVMTEIVKARSILFKIQNPGKEPSHYDFKNHAIHHCLYGVDIDASAVEICKLRLWLSLVVDEQRIDKIEPLPNLDYKIVKGNSLIGMPDNVMRDVNLQKEINELMEKYYAETDQSDKRELKQIIDNKIRQLMKSAEQYAGFPIDFDFKLFFHEVFKEKAGFDVVIANPPYVSTRGTNSTDKNALKKAYGFADDLYSHFFFKSFEILKKVGVLTFITSNTFLTIGTKKNVRHLLQSKKMIELIKIANVFDAMVSPAITVVQNINVPENYSMIFKNAINDFENPEIYSIEIDVYRNAVNSVFFPPTKLNMKFYRKYNAKIKQLHNEWWPKIETSKKINQNFLLLEKYRRNLKPGDIALLGTLTEGGQGLATANNGRFVGVKAETKQAKNVFKSRPIKLYEAVKEYSIPLKIHSKEEAVLFLNGKSEFEIRQLFDELKEQYGRDIFGQGYLYRIVFQDEIANVNKLTDEEKKHGIEKSKPHYVPYDKGDKEGNRWYLETPFVLDWSKEAVSWFYENSGKKGEGMPVVRNSQFYFKAGICWTDVNSTYLKCRIKENGIHDVLSMSLFSLTEKVPEYYIISLINSKFISEYVDDFINNTSHFQINDARQLPIIIPTNEQLQEYKQLFNKAISIKKKQFSGILTSLEADKELDVIQKHLDNMVYKLYF
ncbi:Eco57I restriction-modification methylase domain-containing protein [Calditrichota bacterium GD2]